MNLKNVLRTYTLLRTLTDDESALLETLRGLSEGEREQLVESLSPGKATKKTTKRSTSKSRRASSIAEQIKSTGKAPRCVHEIDNNGTWMPCDALVDDPIHDKSAGYLGYHEFDAGKSRAVSAAGRSSTSGASSAPANSTRGTVKSSKLENDELEESASSTTPNTEDEKVSVGVVAGGSSE